MFQYPQTDRGFFRVWCRRCTTGQLVVSVSSDGSWLFQEAEADLREAFGDGFSILRRIVAFSGSTAQRILLVRTVSVSSDGSWLFQADATGKSSA